MCVLKSTIKKLIIIISMCKKTYPNKFEKRMLLLTGIKNIKNSK